MPMPERTVAPIDVEAVERVLLPFDRARTLPADAYGSTGVFEWERAHFFEGSWVCVARTADMARPGDQRAVELGGRGLLLVEQIADRWGYDPHERGKTIWCDLTP
jgi:hypothetical protein